MIWHNATPQQVINELNTNQYKGLTMQEAQLRGKQAKRAPADRKRAFWARIFMRELKSVPLWIVSVSSLVWLFADLTMVHSNSWWKALVVLGVCLLGAAIDVTKEAVSMKRLIELRNSSQPTATVLRSEQELTISARQLVRGDILFLKQGDYVPADGRILQSEQLRCDEGTLSGEPVSVEKQCEDMLPDITPLAKRSNMVYAGSTVTNGTATVVVVAAGEDTESAKMALIHEDPLRTETPLQKQWKTATRALGTIALVVSVLVFLLGVTIGLVGDDRFVNVLGNTYMACAALAVTVVPESLATTISTVLAVGVSRMCQHKLLVRSMDTAEVLGKVSVICTDKTGTLTQNQMTMTRMYMGEETMAVDDETKLPKEWKNLLLMGAMCCDAQVQQENGKEVQIGDHTEAAIVSAACRFSEIDKETLESMYPRLCEIPFDSDRKLKTSVNMIDGKPVAIVKGAPDIIMERCPACDQEKVTKAAEDMANSALRVIGIAFKALEETPSNPTQEELEYDLIFGGLVGLEDPPIPETVYSLEEAKNAGIKVVMMTGDQLSTAMASAREMGIESDETSVITNEELTEMTDEELDEKIDGYNVYVRLTPELKERVIASLQRKGYVVAVTGDKVEDASLLRQADVGCAMGQDGTDVAKGAAHAVVTDNNFATILYGVSASRGIYENIRRSIFLTIGFGVGLGLLMVCSLIFWQRMPLDAVQIMLLNLLVSVASVLPLGLEPPANKGLLDRAPRKKDRVFDKLSNITAMIQGLLVAAASFVGFGLFHHDPQGSTVAFTVFMFAQLLCAFSARSPYLLLNLKRRRFNYWLAGSAVLIVVLMILLLNVPALGAVFGLSALTGDQIWTVVIASLAPFIVFEALKLTPLRAPAKQQ